jgi:hypothetical protein
MPDLPDLPTLDAEAAHEALQALGLAPGARLLSPTDLVLSLVPREDGLQPKDVPVEQLLAKIKMMRDRLRVAEQRINAADDISDIDRAHLQGHITAVYASFAGLVAFFSKESLPQAEATAPTTTAPTTTAPTTTVTRPATTAKPS